MKKKYIFGALALLGLIGACDDDYNDQFDIDTTITDVLSITYTLTSSDYSSIASNSTNQEIALAKDPETESYVDALTAVGTNKYFTDDATAEDYLPAFISAKYPNADTGSKFVITYQQYQEPSEYLSDFSSISTYTLTSSDYSTVWGDDVSATYLSPSTLSDIPSLLATNLTADEGDIVVVNYAYSDQEPSTGGSTSSSGEPTWTQLTPLTRSAGTNWNYVNIGPISLADYAGETVNIGFRYTSSTSAAATWELKNFEALSVPYLDVYVYAEQDDGTYAKQTSFAGEGNYVFVAMGCDGQYYPFGRLKGDSYTYGYMYPSAIEVNDGVIEADVAADYVITVAATDEGYTLQNAIGKYIYNSSTYNNFNVSDDTTVDGGYFDWTISKAGGADLFEITNVTSGKTVKLMYYSGSYSYGEYTDDYVEGYTYYENTLLGDEGDFEIYDISMDSSLSYVWTNKSSYGWTASGYVSGNKDAESYLISPAIEISESATLPYFTVDEAIRYASDIDEELTVWVSTDYSSSSSAGLIALQAASTSTANAAGVYVYDGSSWSEYTTDEADVIAIEQTVYTSLGADYISSPTTVLPTYLASAYPYAEADTKVGIVYQSSSSALSIVEYTYDGTTWDETPVSVAETATLSKTDTEISAQMSTYLDEDFTNNNDGGFTIEDINLGTLSYVWATTTSYGWKASGYKSGYIAAESWLVSPSIDLRKATAPVLNMSHVHRYLNDESDQPLYLNVKISTDYSSSVSSATWDVLTVGWATGSDWTFVDSGDVDLSDYAGQTVRVAFHYISDTECAATWEIKSLTIKEADTEE